MFKSLIFLTSLLASLPASADLSDFSKGPVFKDNGENAPIEGGLAGASQQSFKVLFDVAKKNDDEGPHRSLNTVARFINMHVRAGVAPENIEVAVVVHGGAVFSLLNDASHQQRFDGVNPSANLLAELIENGVKVVLCGQSAVYQDVGQADLIDGVEMSLSAMTANALLQQQGYTLNPF